MSLAKRGKREEKEKRTEEVEQRVKLGLEEESGTGRTTDLFHVAPAVVRTGVNTAALCVLYSTSAEVK